MIGFHLIWALVAGWMIANNSATQTTIVLIPDSDGTVGELIVTKDKQTQSIKDAYTAITTAAADKTLSEAVKVDKQQTEQLFADALSAQPREAQYFILYFHTGTAELINESKEKLTQLMKIINASRNMDIYISGHTDTQGSDEVNAKLALKRAKQVEEMIKDQLIDSQTVNMRIDSHGEGDPLIKTEDNVNEPRNRRVEVTIHL